MGTECKLQECSGGVSQGNQRVVDTSIYRARSGLRCCGVLDRVSNLNYFVDIPQLKKLLTKCFGASSPHGDALDLKKFAGRAVKIQVELKPCPHHIRTIIVTAKKHGACVCDLLRITIPLGRQCSYRRLGMSLQTYGT